MARVRQLYSGVVGRQRDVRVTVLRVWTAKRH